MSGNQGDGAGKGRHIPSRAGSPERRGETALPNSPAIKGRGTPASLPARFQASSKCTSHLGFGLGTDTYDQPFKFWTDFLSSHPFSKFNAITSVLAKSQPVVTKNHVDQQIP